jgi:hypothetical protein
LFNNDSNIIIIFKIYIYKYIFIFYPEKWKYLVSLTKILIWEFLREEQAMLEMTQETARTTARTTAAAAATTGSATTAAGSSDSRR